MQPRIQAHLRLRVHVPLIVPDGDVGMRLAGEALTWRRGEALVFDDSFVHETWNRTAADRVVLLFDVWHPDLTVKEVQFLSFLQRSRMRAEMAAEKIAREEKAKVKALSEELENSMNVHRWRKLEGSDPATYEMIQKIQTLQKRLISKTEEVVEKDLLITEKEKLYVELKNHLEALDMKNVRRRRRAPPPPRPRRAAAARARCPRAPCPPPRPWPSRKQPRGRQRAPGATAGCAAGARAGRVSGAVQGAHAAYR